MGRVIRYLLILALIGVAALAIYAVFADVPPPVKEITIDVPLPANG